MRFNVITFLNKDKMTRLPDPIIHLWAFEVGLLAASKVVVVDSDLHAALKEQVGIAIAIAVRTGIINKPE